MIRSDRAAKCFAVLAAALVAVTVGGCASLPTSSAPQALGTVARDPATPSVPVPTPGREPQLIVRDFVKASTEPADTHAAARQFLTSSAKGGWNDDASTTIVDKVDVLEDSRTTDNASYTIRANRVGVLERGGQYQSQQGSFEIEVGLVRVDGEWRIDDLPAGVIMDRTQFLSSYQRKSLYFVDPTATSLVPDPRWVSVGQDQMTDQLSSLLLAGPSSSLAPAVLNRLGNINLTGPITKSDGRTTSVGVGLGGIRIPLTGLGDLDRSARRQLAAQMIWTLAEAEVSGPYQILDNGMPIDSDHPNGWTTADVAEFDPLSVAGAEVGLHALKAGSLVKVQDSGVTTPVSGYFGSADTLRAISLSVDGALVAGVADTGRTAPGLPDALLVGTYGGTAFPLAEGTSITRPSWGPDKDAVWSVIDGTRVIRAVRDPATGQVSVVDVDSSALAPIGGQVSELRLSRDGVRAALIVDGTVYVAVIVRDESGRYSLRSPSPAADGLGSTALSLDWSSGDSVVVARASSDVPIVQVAVDGSRLDALPSRNLTAPVVSVDASASSVFVTDSRAVFEIENNDPSSDRYWREVAGLTGGDSVPVLPG